MAAIVAHKKRGCNGVGGGKEVRIVEGGVWIFKSDQLSAASHQPLNAYS